MHPTTALLSLALSVSVSACSDMDMSVPRAPSDLKVEEMGGGAHLTWKDNSDNESEFMIERKAGSGAFAMLATVPFNTVQHHDTKDLVSGTTYTYRVMAMGKEGHAKSSGYSDEATFTAPKAAAQSPDAGAQADTGAPNASVPKAPSDLKVQELGGGAHLTWKDNSDNESEFMIERKAGSGAFATLTTVPFNTVQHHDTKELVSGTTYTYRVMAMGKEGDAKSSGYSNEATFIAPKAASPADAAAPADGGGHGPGHM